MKLSFHPMIEADKNILCAGREPGKADRKAIQNARAVILPQGCRKSLYQMASKHCKYVFPNYDALFQYPGKTGQIKLFQKWGVPHPLTFVFESVDEYLHRDYSEKSTIKFPCVFKFSWGGEGHTVFYVDSEIMLNQLIDRAVEFEKTGQFGFIIQEYIPCQGRSLRVVVINKTLTAYWRVHTDSFYSNIARGATIDYDSDPHLIEQAKTAMIDFCEKTHINLAGFDFLFHEKNCLPLFLEINYFFGRKGLGGAETYYKMLVTEIKDWLKMVDTSLIQSENLK
ncbi:RimK domain-containing protein ATP-grasp [Candidatus Magnetomorum sp. HK-1]|nr:RimK domain-containing protein ATP-grasp [Candidatus Magnetomorum sp. HK-1]